VTHHAYEPGHFDFKEVLHDKRDPRWNEKIAKAVCSMANTDGGFLIFGVGDRKTDTEHPEDRIVGITVGEDHAKEFGEKIRHVQPEIHFESVPRPIPLEDDCTRGIFVVHVPLSPRRPHMVADAGIFYARGDGGSSRPMTYFEIRDQMLLTEERLEQVRLFRLKIKQLMVQCGVLMLKDGMALRDHLGRLETDGFEGLLATICALIPADDATLESLLAVPTSAQEINRILDRWHFDDDMGHQIRSGNLSYLARWETQIHLQARRILELCAQCEYSLHDCFGPLTRTPEGPSD
jgi:hypothetical protein